MITNKKKYNLEWSRELIITKHFKERYFERILVMANMKLETNTYSKENIIRDMSDKMDFRGKSNIQFFKGCSNVILPMGKHQIILKNNCLITIY